MESLITRDIIPSLSIESFCSNPFSQSSCTAFHFFDLSPSSYFVHFKFAHHTSLLNNSFISKWISMKYQNFTLQANQPTASHCTKLRIHFTLHVGICHNFHTKRMNCMKLYTHKLCISYVFKENMTIDLSRRGLSSTLPIYL